MANSNDQDITLKVVIEGVGKPLLFVHGWAASQRFWKHQVAYFSKKFQVITYDLRGHGDSDKPKKGYRVSDHVQDLCEIIDGLGIKEPVLIGHSLGGMIALQYVLENPQRVPILLLVGTSPNPVPSRSRSLQLSLLGLIIRISRSWAGKITKNQLFAPDPDPALVEWVNAESLRTPTRVVLKCLKALKDFNVLDRIAEISIPTALIRGQFDSAVSAEHLNSMLQLMPKAEYLEVADAGHDCMLEQASQFNRIVEHFLDR
jgi:pimeloyl-ACP methyl ester carboxylesterase